MKRRKPQPVCKCKHAKSQHSYHLNNYSLSVFFRMCDYCWDKCTEFKQDNLLTLERLSKFHEEKKENI
jgi:hypothetical protein